MISKMLVAQAQRCGQEAAVRENARTLANASSKINHL